MVIKESTYQVGDALRKIAEKLISSGSESPNLEARLLIAKALGVIPERVISISKTVMGRQQISILNGIVSRRLANEPMAYILGEREFWSLKFFVTNATLIPRPETETLVECVLKKITDRTANFRILDLGTGSGCILLSLLSELPMAIGIGVDISLPAISIAKKNAARNGLLNRASFEKGNWETGLRSSLGNYDIIVSNPPYIPSNEINDLAIEVSRYEPRRSLDGGEDGFLAYRQILKSLPNLLRKNGYAVFEVGYDQAEVLADLVWENGFKVLEARDDLASVRRALVIGW